MSSHNKVNLLVLIDECHSRKVLRIDRYILHQNRFFILVTDEESFELLRLDYGQEVNELVSLSVEEAEEIISINGINQEIIHVRARYRIVGLLYTEVISEEGSKSYHFKTSHSDKDIDLASILPHIGDFNS
ncbi:hypothetical protein [Paenibacillus sp. USHLN196]|uniref:hypothetical protein n=1 Tax=Paenibacillus sp. USHLN196 TaxID=3081291 RepID=UPI0030168DC4